MMKWFKHGTSDRRTAEVAVLVNEYGLAGYGGWCMLTEIVADYSELHTGAYVLPINQWAQMLRMKCGKFIKFCRSLEQLGLIETEVFESTDAGLRGKPKKIFDLFEEYSGTVLKTFSKHFKNILKISIPKLLNLKETDLQNKNKNKNKNKIYSSSSSSSSYSSNISSEREEVNEEVKSEILEIEAGEILEIDESDLQSEVALQVEEVAVIPEEPAVQKTTQGEEALQVAAACLHDDFEKVDNSSLSNAEEDDMDYEKIERMSIQNESPLTEETEEAALPERQPVPERTVHVSEDALRFAEAAGYNAEECLQGFIEYVNKRNYRSTNWDALFMRAVKEKWVCLNYRKVPVVASEDVSDKAREVSRVESQKVPTSDALDAWNKIAYAIEVYGPSRSVAFDDPKIHLAIQASGGWPTVANTPKNSFGFLRQNITRLYNSLLLPEEKGTYPAYLPGDTEIKNRDNWQLRIDPPYLIGDKNKAAEILGDAWNKLNAMRKQASEPVGTRTPSKIKEMIARTKVRIKELNQKAEEERGKARQESYGSSSTSDLNEYRTDFLDLDMINAAIRERRKANNNSSPKNSYGNGKSRGDEARALIGNLSKKFKM